MTCARAEDTISPAAAAAGADNNVAAAPVSRGGGLIQKVAAGAGGEPRSAGSARSLQRSVHLAAGDGGAPALVPEASCSRDGICKSNGGGKRKRATVCRITGCSSSRRWVILFNPVIRQYRSQLEQEVKKLQRQLEEEVDLHAALADAVTQNAALILKFSMKLPHRAQELLVNIASLETTVSKLEKELNDLYYRLCHERNERLL